MFTAPKRARVIATVTLLFVSVTTLVYEPTAIRPLYVFGVFGLSLTLLLIPVLTLPSDKLDRSVLPLGGTAVLIGLWFRVTAFDVVVSSGIDHYRWVLRVQEILEMGSVYGSDMYASAPFYLLNLAMAQEIAGLQPFQTRFVTIIVAAVTPVLAYTFAWRLTDSRRVGLVVLLVSVPQMLFLRTSALLEAESLAIPWALFALFLLLRFLQTDDRRFLYLFMGTTLLSVFLHFLYALVIFGIAAGTQALQILIGQLDSNGRLLTREKIRQLAPINVIIGMSIVIYIVSSTFRSVVLGAIQTVFPESSAPQSPSAEPSTPAPAEPSTPAPAEPSTPAPAEPSTPVATSTPGSSRLPSEGNQDVVHEIFSRIAGLIGDTFGFLLPTSEAVGHSLGIEGTVTTVDVIGVLIPLGLFLVLATAGGLFTLWRRSDTDVFLLAGTISITGTTLLAIHLDLLFNIGFRLYYFVALLLVVYAGIGISFLSTVDLGGDAVTVAVVFLFLGYAVVGPMSPVGNNVDPRFGGQQWYLTDSEREQILSMQEMLDSGQPINSDIPQLSPHLYPHAARGKQFTLTRAICANRSLVVSARDVRICTTV